MMRFETPIIQIDFEYGEQQTKYKDFIQRRLYTLFLVYLTSD